MGLWRCQNQACSEDLHGRLIFDFEAADPRCPKCGKTNVLNRPPTIVKLEVIHYDPPTDDFSGGHRRGLNEWACLPGRQWKGGHATGDAIAVTCPACKRSAAWRQGMEAMGEAVTPAEADMPVEIDPKEQVIRLVNADGSRESCCG